MRLRPKMILMIAVPTAVIYVTVLGFTLAYLKTAARAELQADIGRLASEYAGRFDDAFVDAAGLARSTARFIETEPDLTGEQIFALLRDNVQVDPDVYGAAAAFEPGTFRNDDALYCPYVYRGKDGLVQMDITRDVYDWYSDPKWQWWARPKATGRGLWTDPYFDDGAGNVTMITYGQPFFRDGKFRGVVTSDIKLTTLRDSIGQRIARDLDFAILSKKGHYVYDPNPDLVLNRTVYDMAKELGRPDLAKLADTVLAGKTGVTTIDGWNAPGRQWVFYAPIESTGWAFAARLPERVALADVHKRMTIATVALAITLLLIVGCIWFISGRISRPIVRLRSKVQEIAGGNLDAHVDGINTNDEIGELASSFNAMTADLRDNLNRLAEERAGREKMERDLDIARQIQQGLLPSESPNVPGFEIAGWSLPAEQTGGDYFDWQPLNDGRFAVSLADVTGHGIGPALVTAVCRAYARASFLTSDDVTAMLSHINGLLADDLPSNRFITFVVALIDPAASRVQMLSAGHGPLFCYRASDDRVEDHSAHGFPFGLTQDEVYDPPLDLTMAPGDLIVLCTDGFFEWANASQELWGTERLCACIRENAQRPAAEIIAAMYESVQTFAGGTSQDDDLTAVIIKRMPTDGDASRATA